MAGSASSSSIRFQTAMKRSGLPTAIAEIKAESPPDADHLLDLMGQDKKVKDGQLTFILLRRIGEAFITRDVAHAQVREFLAAQIKADN